MKANLDRPFPRKPSGPRRPEDALLLSCARTHVDLADAERIRAQTRVDLDWKYLIRTACRHGVLPLIYRSLNTTCAAAVPNVPLNKLRTLFHTNARANLLTTSNLLNLLNMLEAHGIAAIPFKGPVLAASAYGDVSLRQYMDLDIMIRKQDFPKAKDVLLTQGYLHMNQLAAAHEFFREDGKSKVDIQWGFVNSSFSFLLDLRRLWTRAKPFPLGHKKVLNLSPEDLLLILCVHGSKHLWSRLKWVCDVSELMRAHQGMDWDTALERARNEGIERMVLLGVYLACDLLGANPPERVWRRIHADAVTESLATQVRERLLSEVEREPGMVERRIFYIRLRKRLRDKVRYILLVVRHGITPNVKDRAQIALPAFLSPLYYLIRPVRLIGKYSVSRLFQLR